MPGCRSRQEIHYIKCTQCTTWAGDKFILQEMDNYILRVVVVVGVGLDNTLAAAAVFDMLCCQCVISPPIPVLLTDGGTLRTHHSGGTSLLLLLLLNQRYKRSTDRLTVR